MYNQGGLSSQHCMCEDLNLILIYLNHLLAYTMFMPYVFVFRFAFLVICFPCCVFGLVNILVVFHVRDICHNTFFGKVTYQLDLPKSWQIHNVFHVNLLKKSVKSFSYFAQELLQTLDEGNTLAGSKQILKIEVCQHQSRMWNEVLVKWKQYLVEKATWENKTKFKANFPNFFTLRTMTSFFQRGACQRPNEVTDGCKKLSTKF